MWQRVIKIAILAFVVICAVLFALITWQTNTIIEQMAEKRIETKSDLIQKYRDETERIQLITSDSLKLNAWRFKADDPQGIVIILHGMHGMDASSLLDFGHFFNQKSFESFCLDMRAHGYSEGNKIGFGYTETMDVRALLDWIKKNSQFKNKPIILYGVSMGGATAINSAAKYEEIDMVISVSSFKSFEAVFADYMRKAGASNTIITMFKPSIRLLLSLKYNVNPVKKSPLKMIKKIENRPILLIHGDKDQQISVQHAYDLKKAASRARLEIVKGAPHLVVIDILAQNNDWYRDKIMHFINNNL